MVTIKKLLYSKPRCDFWPLGPQRVLDGVGRLRWGMDTSSNPRAENTRGERWFAVHTHPFAEERARMQLQNQRFTTFFPKRQRTIRHARRLTTVVRPFFPRYLFVSFDPTCEPWRRVNGTFGVISLVMQGDSPCPVPCGVVETMMAAADAREVLQLDQPLKVGDSVRLLAGPFAEQLGLIDRLDDSGRIQVLLNLMGRQVRVLTHRNNAMVA